MDDNGDGLAEVSPATDLEGCDLFRLLWVMVEEKNGCLLIGFCVHGSGTLK